jgi:hypothetical protein
MSLRFTIRDLLWLTVVAALTIGLCMTTIENNRLIERNQRLEFGGMKQLHVVSSARQLSTLPNS